MGRDPPYFTLLLPLVPGRSRPPLRGPRVRGSGGRGRGRGRRALAAEAAEGEACWGPAVMQEEALPGEGAAG